MLISYQNRLAQFSRYDVQNTPLIDQMFRARKEIFEKDLGWVQTADKDYEIDEFDGGYPIYLMSVDQKTGQLLASLRLLPTTGKNMLNSAFSSMFNDDVDISSPTIMECTRFAAKCNGDKTGGASNLVSRGISELVLGLHRLSVDYGFTQISGVFSSNMKRFYRRTGWEPEILSSVNDEKCGKVYAGLWDVNAADESAIRSKLNFHDDIEIYFEDFQAAKVAA
ncbi:MAG: acyl-homoserine-lactone synthase [Pseudomonadota bacterium]